VGGDLLLVYIPGSRPPWVTWPTLPGVAPDQPCTCTCLLCMLAVLGNAAARYERHGCFRLWNRRDKAHQLIPAQRELTGMSEHHPPLGLCTRPQHVTPSPPLCTRQLDFDLLGGSSVSNPLLAVVAFYHLPGADLDAVHAHACARRQDAVHPTTAQPVVAGGGRWLHPFIVYKGLYMPRCGTADPPHRLSVAG
jgi:hypothetical protein